MGVVVTHFISLVLKLQSELPIFLKLVPFAERKNLLQWITSKLTELSEVSMCTVLIRIKDVSGKVK